MITSAFVIKLVLVVCMNSDCTVESAYEVDTFKGAAYSDVLADCLAPRNSGNATYDQLPTMRAKLHCWTPKQLKEQGFN